MSDDHGKANLPDDERLAGLIRQGGARLRPDSAMQAAVRRAVGAEWRAVVAERARRRRQRWSLAGLAAAALAGLAILVAAPALAPQGPVVAAVTRVSGPVDVGSGRLLAAFSRAGAGRELRAGSEVRSGAGGRLALRINGAGLRLDQDSEIAILAADRVELRRGAVYLDSGAPGAASPRLTVETRFGSVEHLGTQYETRVSDQGLRVRVREGRVQLLAGGQAVQGTAGEQVVLGADGAVSRQRIARAGGDWAWVTAVAPLYDIQDRPLIEFLRWVSRETGRELKFASPGAEQAAREVVLHGSVQGLSPERALSAVLVTTGLHYTETPEELRVNFEAGD